MSRPVASLFTKLRRPNRAWRTLAVVTVFGAWIAFGSACATDDGAGANVTYSATARQNYDKGLAELADENYLEADKYFRFVKSKFPFSKYAVLAELGMSDAKFQRGEYQAAIDSYKAFIRLHPTHDKVEDGYAAYRIAECYVKDMPEDWLILPPASEKDQSAVKDALRELSDFLDKYPESQYVKPAEKQRREVVRRLVEHEVYVARFYLDQGHPRAAILRLQGAIERFPDSEREAELLLTLGETHLEMGNAQSAKATFEKVRTAYKGEPQARRAQVYLEYIRGRFGDAPTDKTDTNPSAKAASHG
ncbi:MAG: outer membrane protein assembly factor BamD [Deltaproteobacteria bacterium]|nr:outer membrane protein assembly factor BamD [Deltaproteobacteria bacterium]